MKRTTLFLQALELHREDKIPLHKAIRIVQLAGRRGRLTPAEEAELIRLTKEDSDAGFN